MIKNEVVVKKALVCDRCGDFIKVAPDDYEKTKFERRQACIVCGKDLCVGCGENRWSYGGFWFLLCPEHNPTISDLAKIIKKRIPNVK